MDFSVIIPTHRRRKSLSALLDYLKDAMKSASVSYAGEILVVDQAPFVFTEDEILSRKKEIPSLRWIRIEKANLPLARDVGIILSRGEIVMFLDDDLEIYNDYIKNYMDFYRKFDKNITIVTGRLIQPNLKGFYSHLEKVPPYITFSGDIFGGLNLDKAREVQTVKGGNAAYRKKALLDIGGFDFNFEVVAFREEADVVERLKKLGHKVFYIPEVKAIHRQDAEGGERQKSYSELLYWGRRSESLFIAKNFSFFAWSVFYLNRIFTTALRGIMSFHLLDYTLKAHTGMLDGRRISRISKATNFLEQVKTSIKWREI